MINSLKGVASLSDYTHFHGMLCRPETAARCIQSFAGGTILFMPSHYTPATLSSFDCSHKGVLTTTSYYMLVLFSLTGMSTLLGWTDFRMAQEFEDATTQDAQPPLTSQYKECLRVEPSVLEYCKRHSSAEVLVLKRRFEYHFRLVGLEVVMLHFLCNHNKLHLVEVYHFNNRLLREWVAPFLVSIGQTYRNLLLGPKTLEGKAQ
jgi:hypothetical protein